MSLDNPSRIASLKDSVELLNRTVDKLDVNDHVSAQVMLGIAIQMLEEVRSDLESRVDIENKLRHLLQQQI